MVHDPPIYTGQQKIASFQGTRERTTASGASIQSTVLPPVRQCFQLYARDSGDEDSERATAVDCMLAPLGWPGIGNRNLTLRGPVEAVGSISGRR